jgi:sugar O-acyltransferase (sialic acid O-acetyltransferase NeuD family)
VTKKLNLVGIASRFTIEIYQVAVDQDYEVLPINNGYEVFDFDEDFMELDSMNLEIPAALGLGSPRSRRQLLQEVEALGEANWIPLVAKDAKVSMRSNLNEGVFVNNGVVIASKVSIGRHSVLNRLAGIGHHSTISDFVFVAPGAQVLGNCFIGEGSYIGAGSVILEGIRIGDNSIVGAGSIVTKDVPSDAVVYGNPSRFIRENLA